MKLQATINGTLLTRDSDFTGVTHTMHLQVTPEALMRWIEDPSSPHVQDAFPHLNDDEREFIKTGVTSEEWDALLTPEDE